MKPSEVARALRRKATNLRPDIARGINEAAREGLIAARRASSGGYSLATLRSMGHPYSVTDPRPPAAAAIINDQGGPFARSWGVKSATLVGGSLRGSVFNTDPASRYLVGRRRPKS